jgi:hypothetical protein
MLNRILACIVLAGVFFGGVAVAQKPAPSPSPTPGPARGTREYTEAFYERYKQAQAEYDALSADPNATLDALDKAHLKVRVIAQNALAAAGDEADTYSDVKAAKEANEAAEAKYERLKKEGKDYVAEKMAEDAALKTFRVYLRKKGAVEDKIEAAIGIHPPLDPPFSARHQALRDEARRKEAEEAKKKAEAEKKAQEEKKGGSSQAPQCSHGSGLGGAMENLACQEQHSGSGH